MQANPADILRWLPRELRLCLSEKAGGEEKHIYFSAENRQYIFLEYMGDNVLKMRFIKEKEKESARFDVVMTALAFVSSEKKKEIEAEEIEVFCEYDTLFIKVYDAAQKVFSRLCVDVLQGGEMVPLEQELKYSKSIYNKIKKGQA